MKRNTLHIRSFILSLFMLLTILFGSWGAFAYAEEVEYTSATEDLRKAENFDPSYYPVKENDYTISLIQIAESKDKELLVYTYQPAADDRITASSINISRTSELDVTPQNYYLTLLSREGVFCKYVVKDFEVSNEPTRYYAIPSIFRSWVNEIDGDQSGSQTITEKSFEVAEQFRFGTLNGKEYVERKKIDVITVTSKFVGFVRYKDGFSLYPTHCDSHFVAFDTDRQIDKLLEADVFFVSQPYKYFNYVAGKKEYDFANQTSETVSLKCEQTGDYTTSGLFAKSYSWKRIASVNDFLAEEQTETLYSDAVINVTSGNSFTDEAKAELQKQKWVLRFKETDYSVTYHKNSSLYVTDGTLVGDVTILRLKFVTDGVTYNLGVVDNKQTGGSDPVNNTETKIGLNSTFSWILLAILFVVLLIVLLPFLPTILSVIVKVVVWIVKAVFWIVALPFRGIAALVRIIKEHREDRR